MRKFKIKCISSLCLCFMFMSLFTIPSSAHEIYYEGDAPNYIGLVLKWGGEILDGKAFLRINGSYLDGNYSPHLSTIISAWNNAAGKVTTVQASFASSTVDLATASQDYWNQRWRDEAVNTLGVCDNTSKNGEDLNSLANVKAARSKEIGYAQIYFTPSTARYFGDTHRRMTMVHEVGYPNLNKIQTFSEEIA